MSTIRCPVCQSQDVTDFMSSLRYHLCRKCKGVFVHPKNVPADYIANVDYLTNPETYLDILNIHGTSWILGKFEESYGRHIAKPKGSLLEIGSALGHFLLLAYSRGWMPEGIETSLNAKRWADKNLKVTTHHTTLEKFASDKKYDAFVMVEVIEHFYDVTVSLQNIISLSNKPALLFGTTPNINSKSWTEQSHIYDPNDHIFLFSQESLGILFNSLGIHPLSFEYFGGPTKDAHIMFSCLIGDLQIAKTTLVDHLPAGEILIDTVIEQTIVVPFDLKNADFIVAVFFGTYSRKNYGNLTVEIGKENNKCTVEVDVSTLEDNKFYPIMFRKVNLEKGETTLRIIGVDGTSSNAVTAWLTMDTPYGGIKLNGIEHERGLVLELFIP